MASLISEQLLARGNKLYEQAMKVYAMAEEQSSFSVAVVNAVLPARRASANHARRQRVGHPGRQTAIDRVVALENILSMNQEFLRIRQLRTIARERQEYLENLSARAKNEFCTYTSTRFDKFFRILHQLGVNMVAQLGQAGILDAMITPDLRRMVDSTPEEATQEFMRSAGF